MARQDRTRWHPEWWLPVAILTLSLVWLALDRAPWPWDPAWYGRHTIELFETLRSSPLAWPAALARTTPLKPPLMAWIGQFFVPVGLVIGSVDAGLLLSVWATHVAALMLLYRALVDLSGGRVAPAAAGTLAAGAAPVFIVLSTKYLAEGSQIAAVAWFVLIMARAPRWSRTRLAANLLAATSFAMLAKTTSPLYCAAPAMVALSQLFRRKGDPSTSAREGLRATWATWLLALFLTLAALAWYGINFETAAHYVAVSSLGPVAELYGRRDTFMGGLREWTRLTWDATFLRPVGLGVALILVIATARRLFGNGATARYQDACALAALAQMGVALAVFSLSPVRDARYLAPTLPLAGVVLSWAVLRAGSSWAGPLAVTALGAQLVLVQTQVLALWPARPAVLTAVVGVDPRLALVHRDTRPAADLAAIVDRTCAGPGAATDNMVGVDFLDLSGHALTYAAAKERLAGRAGACRFESIGFDSVESARALIAARPYVYWITVDLAVRPIPTYHEFLNRTAPIVFGELSGAGALQPEPWNGPAGVRLFRFVKR